MTNNIQQYVVPRNQKNIYTSRKHYGQRGSIDHATAAIMLGVIAVVVVGMFSFFYLQQVVRTAAQGTDVNQLEQQLSQLKEKQRVLELEGAHLRSLQTIEQQTSSLYLVPTTSVVYLAPVDERVALLTK